MFIEPNLGSKLAKDRSGWIEVIAGCMFSGKTEELIRRLNRAIIAKQTGIGIEEDGLAPRTPCRGKKKEECSPKSQHGSLYVSGVVMAAIPLF